MSGARQSHRNKNLFDKNYRDKFYARLGYTNPGLFTKKALKWATDEILKEGKENPTDEEKYAKINAFMESTNMVIFDKTFASPKKMQVVEAKERINEKLKEKEADQIVEDIPISDGVKSKKIGMGRGKGIKKITKVISDTGAIIPPDTEHIGMEITSANTDGIINNAQHLDSGDSKQTINTEQSTQSDLIQLNNINAFNANYGNNVAAPIIENQLPTETNNVLTPGGLVKVPIISIRDNVEIIKQIEERTPAGKAWTKEQEEDLKRMFGPLIRQQNANYRDQLSINHGISNDYVEKMINASRGVFFDTRKTKGHKDTVKKVQKPYAADIQAYYP